MKHCTRILFAVCIVMALAVPAGLCAADDSASSDITLILYYSKTGNTRAACEALQKETGADMQEIKDLNSREGFWAATGMLKIFLGMQTAIEPETVDFGSYDTLVIAAPIWAAQFALAMRTFVERNDFHGKPVIIFITADSFIEEKYQHKHKALVEESGGTVIGHFQVQAADEQDGEKIPRSKEKIVEETLRLVPDIKACLAGKS